MNYLQYKIVIGDDSGAKIFQDLATGWNSIKTLDDQYFGPDHYWDFYQLGDFNMIDITLIKWELWSQWRLKGNYSDFNNGAFVGVSGLLYFYDPIDVGSYNALTHAIEIFYQKRQSNLSPLLTIAVHAEGMKAVPEKHQIYIREKGGVLITIKPEDLEKGKENIISNIFSLFVQSLQPDRAETLSIRNNWWHLPIDELRAILMADRQGIKLRPRHAPPRTPVQIPEIQEEVLESKKVDELTVEEREHVAISPEGEVVPISKDISQEEVLELIKKGYTLPAWVVIPRHCPKCYNQNQRTIREVVDKSIILMENPRIYGKKLVCGNCGKEWH